MAALRVREVVVVERLRTKLRVSIVIPVFNESKGLKSLFLSLEPFLSDVHELIFVDGGSVDNTRELITAFLLTQQKVQLLCSEKGRAKQMNAGGFEAEGDVLVFLHADTFLPPSALNHLNEFSNSESKWGRFNVSLDNNAWPFRIISWFINHRSRLSGISTGDQAIFVSKKVFDEISGYTGQPLMEDVELSKRLKRLSAPFCIADPVITSARKWEQGGILKTIFLMWRLRIAYALGARPEDLVDQYYMKNK